MDPLTLTVDVQPSSLPVLTGLLVPHSIQRHLRKPQDAEQHREREAWLRDAEGDEVEEVTERPGSLPDDVPTKTTISVKEINESRYHYWQWRDGEKIKSKYKGPVNSSD